jgi:hypothetical protein
MCDYVVIKEGFQAAGLTGCRAVRWPDRIAISRFNWEPIESLVLRCLVEIQACRKVRKNGTNDL